jgi:hypothetical protein
MDRERSPAIPYSGCIDRPLSAALFSDDCRLGSRSVAPTIVFWGDSHALAWAPAIDAMLLRRGLSAHFVAQSACPPLERVGNPEAVRCLDHNRQVVRAVLDAQHLRTVILAAAWSDYVNADGRFELIAGADLPAGPNIFTAALHASIAKLRRGGKHVWLIGPVPRPPGDAPLILARAMQRQEPPPPPMQLTDYMAGAAEFFHVAREIPQGPDFRLTQPGPWLCDRTGCRYTINGMPLYRDSGHLNSRGTQYLLPLLEAEFDRFVSIVPPASR